MGVADLYAEKLAKLTPEQQTFVRAVYAECEKHYSDGGDVIVECYEPADIVEEFSSMQDVVAFIGLKVEQELNARPGNDDDPQLDRMRRYEQWNDGVQQSRAETPRPRGRAELTSPRQTRQVPGGLYGTRSVHELARD